MRWENLILRWEVNEMEGDKMEGDEMEGHPMEVFGTPA